MKKFFSILFATVIFVISTLSLTVSAETPKDEICITTEQTYTLNFGVSGVKVTYDKNMVTVTANKNSSSFKLKPKVAGNSDIIFTAGKTQYKYKLKVTEVTSICVGESTNYALGYSGKLTRKVSSKDIISTKLDKTKDGYLLTVTGKKTGNAEVYLYAESGNKIATLSFTVKQKPIPIYTLSCAEGESFTFNINEKFDKIKLSSNLLSVSGSNKTISAKATAAGTTTAYAYRNGKKVAQINITVNDTLINGLSQLYVGYGCTFSCYDSVTLKTVGNASISWGSTNPNVLYVDGSGNVSALSRGTATIVVAEKSTNTQIATFAVTVS